MAVWALGQLMPHDVFLHARDVHAMMEPDLAVKAEWSSP
jgi:hypothetical protein